MMRKNIFSSQSIKAALLLSALLLALIVVHRAELSSINVNQQAYEVKKQSASSDKDSLAVKEVLEAKKANALGEDNQPDTEAALPAQPQAAPNITPFQPNQWSDEIVVSKVTGGHLDSSPLNPTDTLFVDWAAINSGDASVSVAFRSRLFVDGVERGNWITNPPLGVNFFTFVDDFSIGSLSAGNHTLRIVVDNFNEVAESNEFDNEYTKFITVISAGQPNLTPFQPNQWSDEIVVSKVTGGHLDSSPLNPTDTLFVDWAAINNGTAPTLSVFRIRLLVDGIERGVWISNPPLDINFFAFIEDFSIGSLSVGTHTLKIVVDIFNEVAESNEFDNEYTKFITVISAGQPNLTPFQPDGWSDKIVVSKVTGSNIDGGSFSPTDPLFVDWAVLNNGIAPTLSVFRIRLFVDGVDKGNWTANPPLNPNFFGTVTDFPIGSLSAGNHTLRIVVDNFNEVAESNEFDNEHTKFITVTSAGQANLTPFQPNGWSDKIVVSNVTGTHSDSGSFSPTDTLFVDWAAINNGTLPVSAVFRTRLFVDGIEKGGWFTNPPLNVNSFAFAEDFSIGSLSAGSHTLRLVVDFFNEIAEGNELDNEYTKTISVSSQQCFTLTVNVSPSNGGNVGKSPQSSCSSALNINEPDTAPRLSGEMATSIASPSGASRTAAVAQTFSTLISKAEAGGTVRVIVGLRNSYRPEGSLISAQAVQSQRDDIALTQGDLLNQMSTLNVQSVKKYKTIPFLAMEVDAAGLKALEVSPTVTSIEEVLILHSSLAQSNQIIGTPNAWASGFSGAGQVVAILDSGVDKNHSFLTGKVVSEACFSSTTTDTLSTCPGGAPSSISPGSGLHCSVPGCAHGTHVAGIAAGKGSSFSGVAKDANIIAIQVFSRLRDLTECSRKEECTTASLDDIVAGLDRVQELAGSFNIAAVNMSLGVPEMEFTAACDNAWPSMTSVIESLRLRGIATIIASGNDGFTNGMSFPACISSAIRVGSTGDGSAAPGEEVAILDTVVSTSNSSSFLNLLAPGKWINSSVPGGFANFSGTSMAAPHVAGAWAILRSKSPTASVDQILSALTSSGIPITDFRNGIVKPRIQVDAAVNALGGGGGGGGGVSQYRSGSTVTLTANPNSGFAFVKWQRDGVDFSTSATVNVLMGSDHTMMAVFRATGSPAPTIVSLTFDGKKNMRLDGSGFGLSPRVMINNVDRAKFIKSISNLSISLKAKRKKLGLKDGDNTVQVIDANGAGSNIALLRL